MASSQLLIYLDSESEIEVVSLNEDGRPEERVELALKNLPGYDPSKSWSVDSFSPFRYWKIRDYAYAYRSKLTTPSIVSIHKSAQPVFINYCHIDYLFVKVAERFISVMEEFSSKKPPTPLLITYDPDLVRKQAATSTRRFDEG